MKSPDIESNFFYLIFFLINQLIQLLYLFIS